ncbi:ATP-binding cassette domain-containing protein [Streptomyces sp. NEAU-S77]|uniref:ATP-binding cassette domain-containing protein n=1 Tax=Streptomyces sp. NEAU-S77 TaxID=3411033 RepID=UPI003B9F5E45
MPPTGAHRKPSRTGRHPLRPVLAAHRRDLALLIGWSLLGTAPALLSGRLVATALDRGFLADDARTGLVTLAVYGLVMVAGAYGTRQAVPRMATVVEAMRDHLVTVTVRGGLHGAVADGQPPRTSAVSRITDQTERARQLLSNLLMTACTSGFTFLAAVAGLTALAPAVGLLLLPVLCVTGLALLRLSRTWRRRYDASLDSEETVAEESGRVIGALRDVLACGAVGRATADLEDRLRANARAAEAVATVGGVRTGLIGLAARTPLVLLLLLGPRLVAGDALTPGELLGAATYLVTSLEPALRALVHSVGNMGLELATVLGRLARHTAPAPPDPGGPHTTDRYDLALEEVTFRYGPHSAPVLDRATVTVPYGQHLTLVGASGIGKSTLVGVLAGLERPERGTVRLGGASMPTLRTDWLRSAIALVPQEAYVFAGTLRENLTYLHPGVEQRRLDHAVSVLGLTGLVREHGGYDGTPLRPTALSAGQRQLITLARVYLSPARVVILDEATCHLDPVAEERVERAFRSREGTLIVIAHRISSALRADRVLVLDTAGLHGGTHASLVRDCATYANLVGHWRGDDRGSPGLTDPRLTDPRRPPARPGWPAPPDLLSSAPGAPRSRT